MANTKRKKPEKGYTYQEYLQKFRPKSQHKDTEETGDKGPFVLPSHSALDDSACEDSQGSSNPQEHE